MRLRTAALALALALLSACGGGGGGGGGGTVPQPGSQTTVSGTAAANVALADYILDILAPAGTNVTQSTRVTAGTNGSYSATAPTASGPFPISASRSSFLEAEPQYLRLYSIAHRSGTANVTPLTSLLVAGLLNRKPDIGVDIRAVFQLQSRSEADVSAAQQQVINYLLSRPNPVDVRSVTNFISTPLAVAPGNAYFDALTTLHNSLMDSETIDGVEEHMLFRNDGPASLLAMFALDFTADCTALGVATPATPSGTTRIILDPRAINFVGFVDLPFQTGNTLAVNAGLSVEQRWLFGLGNGQSVDFTVKEGRLNSVLLSTGASSARCFPQSEVPLEGKHPSLMALISLLAQTVGNPASFQCAAGGVFFPSGPNALSFDTNGAVRFNTPNGPALHLASLNIGVAATLTVGPGGVVPMLPEAFTAGRTFRGGFDGFDIKFTPLGPTTGVRLSRQQNGGTPQSQSCGII